MPRTAADWRKAATTVRYLGRRRDRSRRAPNTNPNAKASTAAHSGTTSPLIGGRERRTAQRTRKTAKVIKIQRIHLSPAVRHVLIPESPWLEQHVMQQRRCAEQENR